MKKEEISRLLKIISEAFLELSKGLCDEEDQKYTKEDVRALLAEKAKINDCQYKTVVKELVSRYSSDGTLTKVPEEKYPELMAELEAIGNG